MTKVSKIILIVPAFIFGSIGIAVWFIKSTFMIGYTNFK